MKRTTRYIVTGLVLLSLVLQARLPVSAAPILTIAPLAWNVIGLDSIPSLPTIPPRSSTRACPGSR